MMSHGSRHLGSGASLHLETGGADGKKCFRFVEVPILAELLRVM